MITLNRGVLGDHQARSLQFGEGAFAEAFIQRQIVNYKNVLIRCHKRKVWVSVDSEGAQGLKDGGEVHSAKDISQASRRKNPFIMSFRLLFQTSLQRAQII